MAIDGVCGDSCVDEEGEKKKEEKVGYKKETGSDTGLACHWNNEQRSGQEETEALRDKGGDVEGKKIECCCWALCARARCRWTLYETKNQCDRGCDRHRPSPFRPCPFPSPNFTSQHSRRRRAGAPQILMTVSPASRSNKQSHQHRSHNCLETGCKVHSSRS